MTELLFYLERGSLNFNKCELFHLPIPPQRRQIEALVPSAGEVSASRDGLALPPESPAYTFLKLYFKECESKDPSPLRKLPESCSLPFLLPHLAGLLSLHLAASPTFTDPSQSISITLGRGSSRLPSALQAHTLLPPSPSHYSLLPASRLDHTIRTESKSSITMNSWCLLLARPRCCCYQGLSQPSIYPSQNPVSTPP